MIETNSSYKLRKDLELEGKTIRLTVGQAVVRFLQCQFSERDGKQERLIPAMFGIFGHGNTSGIGQAVYEYGQDLKFFQPCNEQSMVHTAIGFAKAKRRRVTLACTASIGPGSTNMITGAATATLNRLPVLLLPSDYYATRFQSPVLQQLEHPISADVSVNDCFRPVSRYFDRISRPEQLMTALPEAMRVLTDPAATGAATIALPQDVQTHAFDYPSIFFERRVWRIERPVPSPERIREAARLLKTARRPLIIAGGGVLYSEAEEALAGFAKRFGIPVGETFAGKGAFQEDSDLLLGGFGVTGTMAGARIAAQSDLVICIGTRLTDFSTASHSAFQSPDVRFVSINVSGQDAHKLGALPIIADARLALSALAEACDEEGVKPSPDYLSEIARERRSWLSMVHSDIYRGKPGAMMTQSELIGRVNESAQPGDTIIAAAGSPPGDLHCLWNAIEGRNCHLEFGNSCMGYEIPAGLGVRLAQPKGEVFVLIGDGTYLMQPTEVFTAAREGIKITILVSDNHGHQCIRNLQDVRAGHSHSTEFKVRNPETGRLDGEFAPIDLAQNAQSMGANVWRVSTPEELSTALREARSATGPCVIVAATDPYRLLQGNGLFWDIGVAETSHDEATKRLFRSYREDRARYQRFYY